MSRTRIDRGTIGFGVTILLAAASATASAPATGPRPAAGSAQASSQIAFISEPLNSGYAGVLWVMNSDGSGQRRLAPGNPGMRWSPDGQRIAFVGSWQIGHGLYVMNADGSGLERLTSPVPGRCDGLAHWLSGPAWSPDGRAIAFTRSYCDRRYSEIYFMNADGSDQQMLARNPTFPGDYEASELAWSPRGNEIAFVSRRDGSLEIYVMNADGSGQRRLTRNTVRDANPVWSPDGRRIAFESNWQVWVMNADGSRQRRLTRNGARNLAPAWSPNGQRIAFERRPSRCTACARAWMEVRVMNADGSRQRRLTRRGAQPGWSPDGRTIAFVSKRDGQHEIYVMNADGSGQRNLTRTRGRRESSLVWSPARPDEIGPR